MEEIWKDIEGYEGLYQVSNLGRVKSLEKQLKCRGGYYRIVKEQSITPLINKKTGYAQVSLHDKEHNKKRKAFYVHRLVAMSFIPNPHNMDEVNHKDEVKTNNHVDNLEWCSRKYNENYGTKRERAKKLRQMKVAQYDLEGNLVKTWNSLSDAERCGFNNISKCVNGIYKQANGFIWRKVI